MSIGHGWKADKVILEVAKPKPFREEASKLCKISKDTLKSLKYEFFNNKILLAL